MQNLYAIFGNPVSHSKSPLMHNLCFEAFSLPSCYTRVLLHDGAQLKKRFHELGLSGANITVPHKEAAFAACDLVCNTAQRIGAINTLVKEDGTIKGYNTDAGGFMLAVQDFAKQKVLILGAGGTAKAIAYIMDQNGLDVTVLNRSKGRLASFDFCKTYDWSSFGVSSYDLIVNTTSAGLSDESLPLERELLVQLLEQAKGAVDVIYGKQTPFLQLAQQLGKHNKDGADMLLFQGVLAFELFTKGRFKRQVITQQMQKAFIL
ncbi:MAG: shikimate dehydrogenase [Campylobacterota bacterium]